MESGGKNTHYAEFALICCTDSSERAFE